MQPIAVTTFYKFFPLKEDALVTIQERCMHEGNRLKVRGLLLVASEGINGTIAGYPDAIREWKEIICDLAGAVTFKDSESQSNPFKRFRVKIRREIVHIGDEKLVPTSPRNNHVTPTEWDAMTQEEGVVILDTRNTYETAIGMFEGATDPKIQTFTEFPAYVKSADIPKDTKIMMYCTGGIRCEKALLEMRRQGYSNVYQLDGGILRYMQERPHGSFRGECFVFDHRVAVDTSLKPSARYHLCPHCGDPGDNALCCAYCKKDAIICAACFQKEERRTCSKNCAHHCAGNHQKVRK